MLAVDGINDALKTKQFAQMYAVLVYNAHA